MSKTQKILLTVVVLFIVFPVLLRAYTGNTEKTDGVTITINKIEKVTAFETPFDVAVTVRNDSDRELRLTVSASSIETIKNRGETRKEITVSSQNTSEMVFSFFCEGGTYTAHYPIHVVAEGELGDRKIRLEPVQVVETDFTAALPTESRELPVIVLPRQGGFPLYSTNSYRVVWNYDGKEPVMLPVGWQGSDQTSRMSFVKTPANRGGFFRESFSIHPPWLEGAGTMFTEYRVKLPEQTPVTLSWFAAIRDVAPTEPESDGVTYAVWVNDTLVQSHHVASKTWTPLEVDLSAFAGQEILLRLQSDPGPARDTTCDNAFWGDPIFYAGERPLVISADEKIQFFRENLAALKTGQTSNKPDNQTPDKPGGRTQLFSLEGGLRAAITLGNNGFIDGVIGLGNEKMQIQYDGLAVSLKGQPLGRWPSTLHWGKWSRKQTGDPNFMMFEQEIGSGDQKWTLTTTIKVNGPAIQLGVLCDDPAVISSIAFGPVSHHADRVYYGHGYCVEAPKAFWTGSGGHNLSTSHVGFDFENGLSLLMATTAPPMDFVVQPEEKIYTLTTAPNSLMTLLPGTSGAMECAVRYRPIYDKKAAPGVMNKAGRFVFDVWGGRYADHTKLLKQQIEHGVTDAIFINHNWQRWGYDNRLPDIWPPNERLGTLAEVKETLELCRKHGILYGLHDNYIDFYPDAKGFGYDNIMFLENGTPRQGWNNYGIDAQSYQFRPDRFAPFLEDNLSAILKELPLTTYFVDVFASIDVFGYYDRDGKFHPRNETLAHWNKSFDTIRNRLGNDLPTISEAGDDFLIGHLDGADCQFLMLANDWAAWRSCVPCKQWSRVPWFDMVNHTRFSLHGVGYDSRYIAERGNALHGYVSDDYMSAEVLTGHALMVGFNTMGRDSIRKYRLLQPLIRNLADKEILSTEFVGDNLYRLKITWNDGTLIYVNRAEGDWTLEIPNHGTVTLPQYGFYALNDAKKLIATVQRQNGHVVELSQAGEKLFFNPRNNAQNTALPILPIAGEFQVTGENEFELPIRWNVFRSLEGREIKADSWYMHLEEPRMNWFQKLKLIPIGGGTPTEPVAGWKDLHLTDTGKLHVPTELPSGTYNVLVGLYNRKGDGRREELLGPTPGASSILIGKLSFTRQGEKVSQLKFQPETEDAAELFERLLPPRKPVGEIRGIWSDGAFLAEFKEKELLITPLLNEQITEIAINLGPFKNDLKTKDIRLATKKAAMKTDKTDSDFEFKLDQETLRLKIMPGRLNYQVFFE